MENTKKKTLIGAGCFAGGVTAAWFANYFVTKKLVELALDREAPKLLTPREKEAEDPFAIGEEATLKMDYASCRERAAELLCRKVETQVEITSRDGVRLIGHWWTCAHPKRVIVAMHGWRSSWSRDFGLVAEFLHKEDCNILFVEQRGQNNSDGEYMCFGLQERFDCLDWLQWVTAESKGRCPVYLYGVSMGAATVLMASGQELPETVRGIIADCGFTSIHDIWKHVANKGLHMPYNDKVASAFCRNKIQTGTKEYSTLDAMAQNELPILFIHGADDDFVPVQMTYENYKTCKARKRLLVVPGAKHAMSYYTEPERYEAELQAFWRENETT